jgi:hypothetical protein
MKRRTRWMDPATRATVDVIRAAAAPGVQPDAVRRDCARPWRPMG